MIIPEEKRTKYVLALVVVTALLSALINYRITVYGNELDEAIPQISFSSPEALIEAFRRNGGKGPFVSSDTYAVYDLQTGTSLIEKNADAVRPIASVTKLMAALVASENIAPEEGVTISRRSLATEGSSGGLIAGDVIPARSLYYPLLFVSSNDAAEAFAEHIGRPAFLDLMNKRAKELGMTQTHFDDPAGLSKKTVSTARDLYLLAKYLSESRPDIIDITREKVHSIGKTEVHHAYAWYNASKFVRDNDRTYAGGKAGYIPEALQTGLYFFNVDFKNDAGKRDGTRKIAVLLLRSASRQRDLVNLARFVSGDVRHTTEPSRLASLVFVGDVMLDRGVRQRVYNSHGGEYAKLFENSFFIKNATLAFANLEGPVSDVGYDLQNLYSFRMEPRVLEVLKRTGFDVLSVANNHVGDWGRAAFEDTLRRVAGAGILPVGGGDNRADAERVRVLEANGLRIGFLAFTDVGPEWLAENPALPVVLPVDDGFDEIIKKAASEVDHLVVSLHFGPEYQENASERQKELARRAIDAGARIVAGHHPHVIQEVENYNGGVIAYSLGNYVFDQKQREETMRGLVLEVLVNGSEIEEVNQGIVQISEDYVPILLEDSEF